MRKSTGMGWHYESHRHALASKGIKTGTHSEHPLDFMGAPLPRPAPIPAPRNIRESEKDDVTLMMAWEDGTATRAEVMTLFSRLVRNGQAWQLQGMYGRQAEGLIDDGYIDRQGNINWEMVGDERADYNSTHPVVLPPPEHNEPITHGVDMPEMYLEPRYDGRASFYRKAGVRTQDGKTILRSYGTDVAYIENGRPVVRGTYSSTTLRHIKEFLKQYGFRADTSAQIIRDYPETR
jgi:hypothetical protein